MRVLSQNELSTRTRSQLYALLVQFQAVLFNLAAGSTEYRFVIETIANIRVALAGRMPSPDRLV